MLDLDAYLDRIGLAASPAPSLHTIHRAHAISIPFENLDPHRGIRVSLQQEDLEQKMVARRRGGYCFEQNLLLASALEDLGLHVEPMLARVRAGDAPTETRALTHLVLRVTDGDGLAWLADVGFGVGTPLDPLPFGPDPDAVDQQSGWSYRVIEDGPEIVLQSRAPEGWSDLYGFEPRPVHRMDIELSNWWVCTHPRSPFVYGLIASIDHDDGRRESISDWSGPLRVTTTAGEVVESSEQPRTVIPGMLERFGLPGFTLGEDGRVRENARSMNGGIG